MRSIVHSACLVLALGCSGGGGEETEDPFAIEISDEFVAVVEQLNDILERAAADPDIAAIEEEALSRLEANSALGNAVVNSLTSFVESETSDDPFTLDSGFDDAMTALGDSPYFSEIAAVHFGKSDGNETAAVISHQHAMTNRRGQSSSSDLPSCTGSCFGQYREEVVGSLLAKLPLVVMSKNDNDLLYAAMVGCRDQPRSARLECVATHLKWSDPLLRESSILVMVKKLAAMGDDWLNNCVRYHSDNCPNCGGSTMECFSPLASPVEYGFCCDTADLGCAGCGMICGPPQRCRPGEACVQTGDGLSCVDCTSACGLGCCPANTTCATPATAETGPECQSCASGTNGERRGQEDSCEAEEETSNYCDDPCFATIAGFVSDGTWDHHCCLSYLDEEDEDPFGGYNSFSTNMYCDGPTADSKVACNAVSISAGDYLEHGGSEEAAKQAAIALCQQRVNDLCVCIDTGAGFMNCHWESN